MPPWRCARCESGRERSATPTFTHDGLEAALRSGRGTGHQSRPDVPADPRRRLRAQERAAAVRHARSAGPRDLLERIDHAIGKTEIDMTPSNPIRPRRHEVAAGGPSNFIREIILEDLRTNKWQGRVQTRFPPEPNGYLHIGHAKSICLNFGLAAEFGGKSNLRFDDTNPRKRRPSTSIRSWTTSAGWASIGKTASLRLRLLRPALRLGRAADPSRQGLCLRSDRAKKCASTAARSPSRARRAPTATARVEENLDLFERMKAGEFPDGSRTLRAKIDMASPNLNMRDPVMYRILHADASPHRRRVVHLSDVRLRARPVRFHRRHHALHLHARIRRPPSALRLVSASSSASIIRSRSSSTA